MIILFIIILVFLLSKKNENFSDFPTMSYVYKKDYLTCCKNHGCSHWKCSKMIKDDLIRIPLLKVGYLELIKNKQNTVPYFRARQTKDTHNIIQLYKKQNVNNKNVDDYYYLEPTGTYYSKFIKMNNNHNYNENEVVHVNDIGYRVKYLGENEMYNSFVPIYPELLDDPSFSSLTNVNYNYPKSIDGFFYIGRLINKWHHNGNPLNHWFSAEYYLYGVPLEDGLKYKYIIIQRSGNKYKTIWTFVKNKYQIGDFIHLRKANRSFGPFFLIA